MITSIEQTMKDNHTAIRERLGMGVMARPVIPLRIAPVRVPDPPKPILTVSKPSPLTDIAWRNIISEVMQKHGVNISELMGSKRKREYIAARREVAWRLLTERGMTYNAIARRMGYLDHSSIINLIEGYEKEHGGTRRNSKEAVAKKRIERNANFIRRLNEGAYVSELAKESGLSGQAVRQIAKGMGFDFSQGFDARAQRAALDRREEARKRKAMEKEAEKDRKLAVIAEANRREKAEMVSLAEQYYSPADCARATGMAPSTVRTRAIRHNVIFRNQAVSMPLKDKK